METGLEALVVVGDWVTVGDRGSEGNSPVVTFILDLTYVELLCVLRLTSDLCGGSGTSSVRGRPKTVLDGSSA